MAYKGYGTYREGCTLVERWNAWSCSGTSLTPARLVVESLDEDHLSRSLVPVALASGGYVDLMNAGWDHQRPKARTSLVRDLILTLTVVLSHTLILPPLATPPREAYYRMWERSLNFSTSPLRRSHLLRSYLSTEPALA